MFPALSLVKAVIDRLWRQKLKHRSLLDAHGDPFEALRNGTCVSNRAAG